jgi:hypothetical protein
LAAHIDTMHLPFSTALDRNSPLYLIEPPVRGDEVGVMISRIKKAGYGRYRSFTPDEDARLSATDAIRQVAAASGIFIPLQDPAVNAANVHNIRCMFVAGLADGMGTAVRSASASASRRSLMASGTAIPGGLKRPSTIFPP